MEYPILEFDDDKDALIMPSDFAKHKFESDKMVITFFPEVLEHLKVEGKIALALTVGHENVYPVYRFTDGSEVMITLGAIGCPACAGNLDLFNAMGIRKVMFCGGGGVLDSKIAVGQLLLVDGAIRDEGFSYHYVEPSRIIYTDKTVTDMIAQYLDQKAIPYIRGLTWTTDALFRETKGRIQSRKAEGAKIAEMEQAGCIAVARCRAFDYGALIYGGDDCASETWSNRNWNSRYGVRYDLVMLCKEIVTRL